jgi:hypothetical protein
VKDRNTHEGADITVTLTIKQCPKDNIEWELTEQHQVARKVGLHIYKRSYITCLMLNKYIITCKTFSLSCLCMKRWDISENIQGIQQLKPNHRCWFWSHMETMPWDHNNPEYTGNESSELNADNMGCQTFLNKNQIDHLETKGRPKDGEVIMLLKLDEWFQMAYKKTTRKYHRTNITIRF